MLETAFARLLSVVEPPYGRSGRPAPDDLGILEFRAPTDGVAFLTQ